jgi:Sel1 repeat
MATYIGRRRFIDGRDASRFFAPDQAYGEGQRDLGAPRDDGEAARLYKLAADRGNASAQVRLGVFYEDGRGGLPKDDRESRAPLQACRRPGNAAGRAYLWVFHETGRGGLPKDDREAARLYKLAAESFSDVGSALTIQCKLGTSMFWYLQCDFPLCRFGICSEPQGAGAIRGSACGNWISLRQKRTKRLLVNFLRRQI